MTSGVFLTGQDINHCEKEQKVAVKRDGMGEEGE